MKSRSSRWLSAAGAVLISTIFLGANSAMTRTSEQGNPAWTQLVNAYFDSVYLPFSPTDGTSAGLHQYDDKLENYSRASRDKEVVALRAYEKKVAEFPAANLDPSDEGDRDFLLGTIRSELLTLETIRPWQKDPDFIPAALPTARSPLSNGITLPRMCAWWH